MPTGACPNWISMSSDGKYAGVSNADSDDTSILDAHTGKEIVADQGGARTQAPADDRRSEQLKENK